MKVFNILFSPLSRLIEIEEAIDGLEAAIDYRNETIMHRQQELRKSVAISEVWHSLSTLATVIAKYFLTQAENRLVF